MPQGAPPQPVRIGKLDAVWPCREKRAALGMAPRRFGFLPQRRPAGRGGLARRGATSPCAAGWLLFLANIRSAQSYALLIGLCPRGRMFIFVDDRTRRRLGRFSVSPRRRPSLRPPKPAWAFSGSPHGARVCGGFDCFLGIVSWVVCFGGVHSLLLAARAAFFLLGCALRFAPSAPRLSPCFFWRGIRLAFARQDRAANRGRAQSRAESGASAHFIF